MLVFLEPMKMESNRIKYVAKQNEGEGVRERETGEQMPEVCNKFRLTYENQILVCWTLFTNGDFIYFE